MSGFASTFFSPPGGRRSSVVASRLQGLRFDAELGVTVRSFACSCVCLDFLWLPATYQNMESSGLATVNSLYMGNVCVRMVTSD